MFCYGWLWEDFAEKRKKEVQKLLGRFAGRSSRLPCRAPRVPARLPARLEPAPVPGASGASPAPRPDQPAPVPGSLCAYEIDFWGSFWIIVSLPPVPPTPTRAPPPPWPPPHAPPPPPPPFELLPQPYCHRSDRSPPDLQSHPRVSSLGEDLGEFSSIVGVVADFLKKLGFLGNG